MNDDLGNIGRAGDINAAHRKIKAQEEQIAQLKEELSKWKVEISIEIDPDNLDTKITAVKPFGGNGVIKRLTQELVCYYRGDEVSLINSINDELLDALVKDVIREELQVRLPRVFANVRKMAAIKK